MSEIINKNKTQSDTLVCLWWNLVHSKGIWRRDCEENMNVQLWKLMEIQYDQWLGLLIWAESMESRFSTIGIDVSVVVVGPRGAQGVYVNVFAMKIVTIYVWWSLCSVYRSVMYWSATFAVLLCCRVLMKWAFSACVSIVFLKIRLCVTTKNGFRCAQRDRFEMWRSNRVLSHRNEKSRETAAESFERLEKRLLCKATKCCAYVKLFKHRLSNI